MNEPSHTHMRPKVGPPPTDQQLRAIRLDGLGQRPSSNSPQSASCGSTLPRAEYSTPSLIIIHGRLRPALMSAGHLIRHHHGAALASKAYYGAG